MIKIYGSSDDLIEIEGEIREEFQYPTSAGADKPVLLICSNKAMIEFWYDGEWKARIKSSGDGQVWIKSVSDDGEFNDYSDVVTINDSIIWVALCTDIARRPRGF